MPIFAVTTVINNKRMSIMKRIADYLTLIIILTLTVTMQSCIDDDVEQAYDMNGIWQGSIYGNYYADRYHDNASWDTEIQFVQEGDFSRGGWGTEVDYNTRTNRIVRSSFDWEVRNGRIYIDYDDGYHIVIRDYELYQSGRIRRFKGIFEDWETREDIASFNLIKVSNWTDWDYRVKCHQPIASADSIR